MCFLHLCLAWVGSTHKQRRRPTLHLSYLSALATRASTHDSPMPSARSLLAALALSLVFLALGVSAHVEMTNPPPRNSKYVKGATNIDYDNLSPLGPTRPFPCQGKSKGPIVATYQAGSSISVQLGGSATHDGGHCQFALSYDNGNTFVVLSTVKRECLRALGNSYTVPIPAGAPSGDAIASSSLARSTSGSPCTNHHNFRFPFRPSSPGTGSTPSETASTTKTAPT
ncbi:hypothetical protein M427DRAFT_272782 [Gonapodya prolifera JEL478]|uniref:Uncharacterized protein n=1 Tax=Gonapodya prolifera (strain JEL478) TaxID=1344416 RepID=A0A139AXV2_GONPJ|nr:hypothetical protein M427DRAFT_272782 [Gonapodya prolifera JEL478]|eukprot:KXS21534.1 hypothetical protein M427DRAFT_272782 [Gonapodya prolifera JEL478]